jgi:hypothetical protein
MEMMRENNKVYQLLREWEAAALDERDKRSWEEGILDIIDRIQQEAFMEGYQYAIKVLNECMVKKKEN